MLRLMVASAVSPELCLWLLAWGVQRAATLSPVLSQGFAHAVSLPLLGTLSPHPPAPVLTLPGSPISGRWGQ